MFRTIATLGSLASISVPNRQGHVEGLSNLPKSKFISELELPYCHKEGTLSVKGFHFSKCCWPSKYTDGKFPLDAFKQGIDADGLPSLVQKGYEGSYIRVTPAHGRYPALVTIDNTNTYSATYISRVDWERSAEMRNTYPMLMRWVWDEETQQETTLEPAGDFSSCEWLELVNSGGGAYEQQRRPEGEILIPARLVRNSRGLLEIASDSQHMVSRRNVCYVRPAEGVNITYTSNPQAE